MRPPTPGSPPKKVNWDVAKRCLAELHRRAPSILQQGVLIGGIACWFYRNQLAKAHDPDFRVPEFSSSQEEIWLSKDIDFTNFFAQDARDLLKDCLVQDAEGRLHIQLVDVPIGFAQVGVTFDPESAWEESWIGSFSAGNANIQFRVLHPVALYREKLALSQRRSTQSDILHCALLAEYLRFELYRQIQVLTAVKSLEQRTTAQKFLMEIRDRAPEICRDARVTGRVQKSLSQAMSLTPTEQKLMGEIWQLAGVP